MLKILITRKLQPIAKELLSKKFIVEEGPGDRPLSREELKRAVGVYDGILSTLADKFDKDILSQATKVRAIANCAAGLDNIDLGEAKARHITVFNLPDIVTNSTADFTFAILLSFIRKVSEAQNYVKEGRWVGWDPALFLGEELHEKRFGIVGYGKIGRAVAQRALGFGMNIAVFHHKEIALDHHKITQLSWEEFLERCDYISLHCPLTEKTYHMIDQKAMNQMKRRPVILNMARGAVICTDDLVEALEKGIIRGAALDVTDPEPISASHPLCRMENCLVVPHIGSATLECRTLMARKAAENLLGFFHD